LPSRLASATFFSSLARWTSRYLGKPVRSSSCRRGSDVIIWLFGQYIQNLYHVCIIILAIIVLLLSQFWLGLFRKHRVTFKHWNQRTRTRTS
jgi:hypothetical protein